MIAFAYIERRAVEPILPLDALGKRPVAASVVGYALGGMVMLGSITYVPLFVQGVIGRSATESGLVLWPQFLGGSVTSFFVGQWISRSGRLRPRRSRAGLHDGRDVAALAHRTRRDDRPSRAGTVLTGVGWGMMAQVFILSVQNAVPRSMISSATAMMVFSRSMGAALGVAAMGAIVNHGLPPGTKLDPRRSAGARVVARIARGARPRDHTRILRRYVLPPAA